eukprot:362818-Chlamydomonas_euryale.AAC.5
MGQVSCTTCPSILYRGDHVLSSRQQMGVEVQPHFKHQDGASVILYSTNMPKKWAKGECLVCGAQETQKGCVEVQDAAPSGADLQAPAQWWRHSVEVGLVILLPHSAAGRSSVKTQLVESRDMVYSGSIA